MSMEYSTYLGFSNGARHHTQNSSSVAWVNYTHMGQVSSLGGVCLWPSSNNFVEYSVVIDLLHDAISHGIRSLGVHLELELVVLQLNGMYHIRYPNLLQIFLRVRLLEWKFETIAYIHFPRNYNQVDDSYANYVLDWHLIHEQWNIHITFTHENINNQSS